MKISLNFILFPSILIIFNLNALAQDIATDSKTGDSDIDSRLVEINNKAASDYNSFRDELSKSSNITAEEIDRYVKEEKMEPADVYFACVLSTTTDRPVSEVVGLYKEKKGWGAVAKELGIKPGSEEFQELKTNTGIKTGNDKLNKNKGNKQIKNSKDKK